MIKKILVFLLWSTQCFGASIDDRTAADNNSNITAGDHYFNNRATHATPNTSDDAYFAAHPQNTTGASSAGSSLGSGARTQYSNPTKTSNMLNDSNSGQGAMLDLAGLKVNNTAATQYDLCVFNLPSPKDLTLCATDKAAGAAVKSCIRSCQSTCRAAHPTTYQTDCSANACIGSGGACSTMAGALAAVNFQAGCASQKQFLKINYVFSSATGDINTLYVVADPQLSGSPQTINALGATTSGVASGVCSNGIISCQAGTWGSSGNPCEYYQWQAIAGVPGLSSTVVDNGVSRPVNMADLGGCYCVNHSCGGSLGNNLSALNGAQILRDLAGGVQGAILKTSGEGIQVSEVKVETALLQVTINASKLSDCQTNTPGGAPNPSNPSGITTLTGIAQSMTNANPTVDTLADSGAAASASSAAEPDSDDPQGSNISAAGFSDATTRATWKTNYQNHGTNYMKMVTNIDDIAASTFQEVQCTIKRNYGVATVTTTSADASLVSVAMGCSDSINWITLKKTGDTFSLYHSGTTGCGDTLVKSWIYNAPVSGTTTTTIAGTATGSVNAGAGSANLATTASTVVNTTKTLLGMKSDMNATLNISCGGLRGGPPTLLLTSMLPSSNTWTGAVNGDCRNSGTQSVSGTWDYTMNYITDVGDEGIADGCQALAANSDCTTGANGGVKNDIVDGVNITTNFMATGLHQLPSCKNIVGTVDNYTVCRPWWEEKRTYVCATPPTTNTDVADVAKRGSSVSNSVNASTFNAATGDVTYNDTAKDNAGNWQAPAAGGMTLKLPPAPSISCDMVCKVSSIMTDTQVRDSMGSTVNTTNPSAPQRNGVGVLAPTGAPANANTTPATTSFGATSTTLAGAAGVVTTQPASTRQYDTIYCTIGSATNPTGAITAVATDWTCPAAANETIEKVCGCPDDRGQTLATVAATTAAIKDQKCTTGATGTVP